MPTKPPATAADADTRVGEIPIEALVSAQRRPTDKGVPQQTRGEITQPSKRSKRGQALDLPRVIIEPAPSKSHKGMWLFLGLLVAVTAAGWLCRAPIAQKIVQLRSSLTLGLNAAKRGITASQVAPAAPLVTLLISVSPADARLTLDGASITNPYLAQRHSDKLSHNFVADAPGFMSLQRNFQFERDLTVVLSLAPEPAVPAVPRTAMESAPATAPVTAVKKVLTRTKPVPVARKQAKPTASESATRNCNPPYTIDASNVKSFKLECL